MANWQLNKLVKKVQIRRLLLIGGSLIMGFFVVFALMAGGHAKKKPQAQESADLTGIIEESFTEEVAQNALTAQQTEVELLKKQLSELTRNIKKMNEEHQFELKTQKDELSAQLASLATAKQESAERPEAESQLPSELNQAKNSGFWHSANSYAMNSLNQLGEAVHSDAVPKIHVVSFRPKPKRHSNHYKNYLNPKHYVPSNTSVKAVILGGADADSSVNGQAKENGAMIFKFIEDARLPNGQRARLHGCRVSSFTYGDISSERAIPSLYNLSCAYPGQPIIDKRVTGWVFYKGKVGIKGTPVMKDGKVMKWAGLSGIISGVTSAAQYAQSMQNISPIGATSIIPSGNIVPYAAYGGASKSGDMLAQYYIKRAEQYHPIIPIGAGNEVTVVFKDGFYLEPDEDKQEYAKKQVHEARELAQEVVQEEHSNQNNEMNFTVPPQVLGRIDEVNAASRMGAGERQ
ncbi:conjugal transfer protein TraB (plasmid) [Legionella lytica]|uniref:Conjugal transfer protein TraB n=1 Tax=Legionella lytica TaxID=96232 RepID=A0ABY4YD62_9GAMM|nr:MULTISPECIES: TrbI/VirB10 family protein [Legionella]USQ15573.1 conjugal transfer protein TraB [Legionella lytica]